MPVMEKTSLSSVLKTCGHSLTEVVVVKGKQRECCWSVLEGWSWSESQTQLLWPIYPCHSSRGCGGGLDELASQSTKQPVWRVGGVKEEMDENDEKQMEGVHALNFSLRDYLPVTQVELCRCIVGRLYENIPSFLWLQIDQGGLAVAAQLFAAVGEVFIWCASANVWKSSVRRSGNVLLTKL